MTRNMVQRRRLGWVKRCVDDKGFGFIEGEDYRDDIYFHYTVWDSSEHNDMEPQEEQFVEFEIDEDHRAKTQQLRALIVRPSDRPAAKRMSGKDAPHLFTQHHPNARRRKPNWRKKD
ncbi:MAG: cold shock domain-containing protein [Planctomycetota bacterium]